MAKDLFDFTNTDDLPEDLQKRLQTTSNDSAKEYAEILRKAKEAGHDELDINQIMAVALRMEMAVPTQQTVRNHLNKAVEIGLIKKPTRQTYAMNGAQTTATEKLKTKAEVPAETATQEVSNDPLADL